MPTLDALPDPTPADHAAILAPLDAATRLQGITWSPETLTLVLRDDAGAIVGGAIGEVNLGWLHVRILAVAESLRGGGWGSRLMHELEQQAAARGCRHAWVDTFSFQARPFYEKLGYLVFGILPDYPAGHERIFLAKPLTPAGAG